jgi:hypothetical protein
LALDNELSKPLYLFSTFRYLLLEDLARLAGRTEVPDFFAAPLPEVEVEFSDLIFPPLDLVALSTLRALV